MISFKLYKEPYPSEGKSAYVQKGLIPVINGLNIDLCEEGLGFGAPILQYKRDFYFPGEGKILSENNLKLMCKKFVFNLIERNQKETNNIEYFSWVPSRLVNSIYKSNLGYFYLYLWEKLRRRIHIEDKISSTCFIKVESKGSAEAKFSYEQENGRIKIEVLFENVDTKNLQQIYICNELGGGFFTEYFDGSGLKLKSAQIRGWQTIKSDYAVFYSPNLKIGFKVIIPIGLKGFMGREVFSPRHSWSGIILSSPPVKKISYIVKIGSFENIRCVNED